MFKPDIPLLRSPLILENKIIPCDFGILCWNVHKENLKPEFDTMIKNWIRQFDMDILMFQEAVFPDNLFSVAGLSYAAAANIKLRGRQFGADSRHRRHSYQNRCHVFGQGDHAHHPQEHSHDPLLA